MTTAPASRLEDYRRLLSADQFEQLRQSLQRPLLPALRVNTLKIDLAAARAQWPIEYGWIVKPVPFCETGWQIDNDPGNLSRTIEHRTGRYYLQDAASMLPAELFTFDREFPLVLDMAASPGGKTTHLASRIRDRGVILANDASAGRLAALRANVQTWGAFAVAVSSYPGERLGEWLPDTFDYVLLDAPCSGESLRTAERRATRFVSAAERRQLQQRQINLLISALRAVKPGGQIVYATCTLAPDEDEAVLHAVLNRFPRAVNIEPVDHILHAPALQRAGDQHFAPIMRHAVRLWPHLFDTSGFFAALLRKQDRLPAVDAAPPSRSLAQAGFRPLTAPQQQTLIDRLRDDYGFDLSAIVLQHQLILLKKNAAVFGVPDRLVATLGDFPCITIGLLVGEWVGESFVPSHELVSRFSDRFRARRFTLTPEQVTHWLTGGELRGAAVPYATGSVVVIADERGRYLGRGKVLRDRLRNLLPRR